MLVDGCRDRVRGGGGYGGGVERRGAAVGGGDGDGDMVFEDVVGVGEFRLCEVEG